MINRKEVKEMRATLYYCGEAFEIEGKEAKAVLKQLEEHQFPGLIMVKTYKGKLIVNLSESTDFAILQHKPVKYGVYSM